MGHGSEGRRLLQKGCSTKNWAKSKGYNYFRAKYRILWKNTDIALSLQEACNFLSTSRNILLSVEIIAVQHVQRVRKTSEIL